MKIGERITRWAQDRREKKQTDEEKYFSRVRIAGESDEITDADWAKLKALAEQLGIAPETVNKDIYIVRRLRELKGAEEIAAVARTEHKRMRVARGALDDERLAWLTGWEARVRIVEKAMAEAANAMTAPNAANAEMAKLKLERPQLFGDSPVEPEILYLVRRKDQSSALAFVAGKRAKLLIFEDCQDRACAGQFVLPDGKFETLPSQSLSELVPMQGELADLALDSADPVRRQNLIQRLKSKEERRRQELQERAKTLAGK